MVIEVGGGGRCQRLLVLVVDGGGRSWLPKVATGEPTIESCLSQPPAEVTRVGHQRKSPKTESHRRWPPEVATGDIG